MTDSGEAENGRDKCYSSVTENLLATHTRMLSPAIPAVRKSCRKVARPNVRPEFDQNWPIWAKGWPNLAKVHRLLANSRDSPKCAKICEKLTNEGAESANAGRKLPSVR